MDLVGAGHCVSDLYASIAWDFLSHFSRSEDGTIIDDAAAVTAAEGDTSEEAYHENLHAWLLAEDEVNDTMTEDIVENEFMPLIEAGDYETFPAEMRWGDMLVNGNPMTYEEFVAAGGV